MRRRERKPAGRRSISTPVLFERAPQAVVLRSLLKQAGGYVLTPRRPGSTGPLRVRDDLHSADRRAGGSFMAAGRSRGGVISFQPTQNPTAGAPDDEIPPVTPIRIPEPVDPRACRQFTRRADRPCGQRTAIGRQSAGCEGGADHARRPISISAAHRRRRRAASPRHALRDGPSRSSVSRTGDYAERGEYHRQLSPEWEFYPTYLAKMDGVRRYLWRASAPAHESSTQAVVRACSLRNFAIGSASKGSIPITAPRSSRAPR